MKALLKLIVFASVIVLIAIGCKKMLSTENSADGTQDKEFNTAFVKNWYVQTFVNTADWQNVSAKEKNVVDWKNGNYHKVGTMEVIEYPLLKQKTRLLILHKSLTNAEIKKLVNASLKRVAFIKNTKNEITVRELDYIPDWEYLQKKQFDIGNTFYGRPGDDFTGSLVVKSWNGTVIAMLKLKNGAFTKKLSLNANSNAQQSLCASEEACMWYEDCDVYPDGYAANCGEPYMDPTDCINVDGCDDSNGNGNVDPCEAYGNCGNDSGGSDPKEITCEILSQALQSAQFTESTNVNGSSSILSEAANEIQRSDIFECGKYEIPIWATFHFYANNKMIIVKSSANIKKFTNYIFGETTVTGTSVWYSCTSNTLTSSTATISPDSKTISCHHCYHFKVSLLFNGCPVQNEYDGSVWYNRRIQDY